MKTKLSAILIVLFAQSAFGNGSVVGNGAGLSENNFQYAYSIIPTLLNSCVRSNLCELTPKEQEIARKIVHIVRGNETNKNRILFRPNRTTVPWIGNRNKGTTFFETSPNEQHRIAKTGLSPRVPIYVNLDMLYNEHGMPRLDIAHIISILVHELSLRGETVRNPIWLAFIRRQPNYIADPRATVVFEPECINNRV
ncbi:MAG: hypothetical protein RBT63_00315 [Bdellovibrionales bacterium]|jgi:hypothetical protein|nr:hypothetical protein [Bdellovibrionales bacterium]